MASRSSFDTRRRQDRRLDHLADGSKEGRDLTLGHLFVNIGGRCRGEVSSEGVGLATRLSPSFDDAQLEVKQ